MINWWGINWDVSHTDIKLSLLIIFCQEHDDKM